MKGNVTTLSMEPVVPLIQDYFVEPVKILTFSPDELLGITVLCTYDDEVMHAKVV